jgi:hypothetical protein
VNCEDHARQRYFTNPRGLLWKDCHARAGPSQGVKFDGSLEKSGRPMTGTLRFQPDRGGTKRPPTLAVLLEKSLAQLRSSTLRIAPGELLVNDKRMNKFRTIEKGASSCLTSHATFVRGRSPAALPSSYVSPSDQKPKDVVDASLKVECE